MKLIKSLILSGLFLAVIFIAGCNEQPNTSNDPVNAGQQISKFSLPPGTTLDSAFLYIHASEFNGQLVNIYGVSSDWDETTVTWNTKPSIFATPVEGSFTPNAYDWIVVNITGLVGKWLDGTYTNYGLLLDQANTSSTVSSYYSKENFYPPYLEVFYTGGSAIVQDTADAYISELDPDVNFNYGTLYTGFVDGLEKQSLLKFAIEYVPYNEMCETAYAFGGSIATCFLNLSPISANNWGWTNLITPGYTGSWPMYAGAGQCDITKGTLVGHVDVSYIAGTITIDYVLDPGFNLDETHVWIGTDKLPTKRGIYQTAPGKFNYNGLDPVVLTGQTGNKYVAVHAGVCWFE